MRRRGRALARPRHRRRAAVLRPPPRRGPGRSWSSRPARTRPGSFRPDGIDELVAGRARPGRRPRAAATSGWATLPVRGGRRPAHRRDGRQPAGAAGAARPSSAPDQLRGAPRRCRPSCTSPPASSGPSWTAAAGCRRRCSRCCSSPPPTTPAASPSSRDAAATLGVEPRTASRRPWPPAAGRRRGLGRRCVTRWCARRSTRPPPASSDGGSTGRWPTRWPRSGTRPGGVAPRRRRRRSRPRRRRSARAGAGSRAERRGGYVSALAAYERAAEPDHARRAAGRADRRARPATPGPAARPARPGRCWPGPRRLAADPRAARRHRAPAAGGSRSTSARRPTRTGSSSRPPTRSTRSTRPGPWRWRWPPRSCAPTAPTAARPWRPATSTSRSPTDDTPRTVCLKQMLVAMTRAASGDWAGAVTALDAALAARRRRRRPRRARQPRQRRPAAGRRRGPAALLRPGALPGPGGGRGHGGGLRAAAAVLRPPRRRRLGRRAQLRRGGARARPEPGPARPDRSPARLAHAARRAAGPRRLRPTCWPTSRRWSRRTRWAS